MQHQKLGITGNILRVNLTTGDISVEHPDEPFYRQYFGGAGFVSYFLLKELEPGIDPLGPQNKLIFANGPLTGLPVAGSGRHCVGAKSPRRGTLAKAEAGGYWGAELKRAGYDVVIVEGQAERPAYLWIHDGEAELRDAGNLWGLKTKETQEAIREELSDTLVRVASIGPAGENLVHLACIMNDLRDAAARPGLGAVMGSKRLKAIAVRGHRTPNMADPARVRDLGKWMAENVMQLARVFREVGTGAAMESYVRHGNLPIRNFQDGDFPEATQISGQMLRDSGLRIGMESCYACPIRCKKVVKVDEPYSVDPAYGGPEYETLGAFGSACGVSDLRAICKAHELCNAYSLDTISTGITIAFAMECFEKGLLTLEDTGGIQLTFGNAEAMVRVVELVAMREGIGNLLAEGSAGAARRIGRGAEELAMQVKGVEIPLHEPRLKQGMGLLYAVNPYGADHMVGMHDTFYAAEGPAIEAARALGVLEPLPIDDLGPKKVFLAKLIHQWRWFLDSVGLCSFVPYSYEQTAELLRAATGWNTTVMEAMRVGERTVTMARAFNMREGLSSADDWLPPRCFQPTTSGPLKETAIDPEALREALHVFYGMMGWHRDSGVPTREKLEELYLSWVAEKLTQAGLRLDF